MNCKLIEDRERSSCDATSSRYVACLSRIGSILIGTVAALVLLLCSGCQTEQSAPLPEQRTASTPVRLTPGDVIKLSFPATPELNQSQKIRADGKVSLPMIGEETAAGKTLGEFQSELIRLYQPQLKKADGIVTLVTPVPQVVVSCACAKPAKLCVELPI